MTGIQINIDADNVLVTKVYDDNQIIEIDRKTQNVKKFIWEGNMRETGKILLLATKLISLIEGEVAE